ncbi:MAG TPA: Rieske (2Fe-2S) protein [Longimicrobiales bacterium]|nr:Rieske (2Fe-2S) protein [Longimicrobiales bacterium]
MEPESRNARQVDRKGFLEWLLGTSFGALLAAVLYPAFRYVIPPEAGEATVGSVTLPFGASDLPTNSGRIFKFGSRPGIIVRTPSGELRAFSARCTHLDCTVQFRDDISHIWCACHNGHFDLSGRNISGPPPAPLEQYDVNVRGDEVVINRRL